MDEFENMQETEVVEETTTDPFDDWDDLLGETFDDDASFERADEPEEEQTEEEPAPDNTDTAEEETEPEPAAEPEKGNQLFKLKHLGEEKEYSLEDVTTFAQKGMDYDHVKSKLDETTKAYKDYDAFLTKLAANAGKTVEEFMDSTNARLLMADEAKEGRTIGPEEALFRVQRDRRAQPEAEQAPTEPSQPEPAQPSPEEIRHQSLMKFIEAYPGVKGDEIPDEVWQESFKTGDLVGAYARYENRVLKERLDKFEQNQKNKDRSTGSRKTAGSSKVKDAIDLDWDNDD